MNRIQSSLLVPKTKNGIYRQITSEEARKIGEQVINDIQNQSRKEAVLDMYKFQLLNSTGTAKKGLTKTQKTIAIVAGAALATVGTLFGIKKAKENAQNK